MSRFHLVDQNQALYKEFGARLRFARERVRLSQVELGQRVGLSRSSISNIESGRQRILLHQLLEFADAVGSAPDELLPLSAPAHRDALGEGLSQRELEWVHEVVGTQANEGTTRAS